MVQKLVRMILIFALCFQVPAFAQGASEVSHASGPRKQIATIVFAGLAGAILGLSTLSFYGRPQDKLSNIAIGFAVGVIAGTAYTSYQATTKPRTFYEGKMESESWQKLDPLQDPRQQHSVLQAGYTWEF